MGTSASQDYKSKEAQIQQRLKQGAGEPVKDSEAQEKKLKDWVNSSK